MITPRATDPLTTRRATPAELQRRARTAELQRPIYQAPTPARNSEAGRGITPGSTGSHIYRNGSSRLLYGSGGNR